MGCDRIRVVSLRVGQRLIKIRTYRIVDIDKLLDLFEAHLAVLFVEVLRADQCLDNPLLIRVSFIIKHNFDDFSEGCDV